MEMSHEQEASQQVSYRARVSDQPPTLSQQPTSDHSTLTIPSSYSLVIPATKVTAGASEIDNIVAWAAENIPKPKQF